MKLSELARQTGAQVEGDPELEIRGAAGLDEAEAGHVTFLANPRYTPRLQTTRASAVYVGEGGGVGGEDSFIHSGVRLREGTVIGARVRIHDNAVVGSDGFGYAKDEEGRWLKIPQTGRVVVEDDVEIGAGTTLDRASVGETRIARGAKIDNLVQVGHSCTVGEDALLCAQVGLAGSSHIGRRVILAGQAGVAGHLEIGDDVVLTAKSATSHNVPAGKVLSGIPAFDNREWLRATAAFRRLGDMQRTLHQLVARVKR